MNTMRKCLQLHPTHVERNAIGGLYDSAQNIYAMNMSWSESMYGIKRSHTLNWFFNLFLVCVCSCIWRQGINFDYLLKVLSTFCSVIGSLNKPWASATLAKQQALESHLFVSFQSWSFRKGLLCPVYMGVGYWLLAVLLDWQVLYQLTHLPCLCFSSYSI